VHSKMKGSVPKKYREMEEGLGDAAAPLFHCCSWTAIAARNVRAGRAERGCPAHGLVSEAPRRVVSLAHGRVQGSRLRSRFDFECKCEFKKKPPHKALPSWRGEGKI